jgi:hypothetical protein
MSAMSGLASPTLSTEDLDKRIADLKAVESWLNLNLSMLRGTIQTMEVQRSTLATLKTMGASMAEAMRQSGVSAEKMAGMPFSPFFGQPTQGAAAAAPKSPVPTQAAKPAGGGSTAQPGTAPPQGAAAPQGAESAAAGDAAALGMPAAIAWWNMLQEQFTQAVATAMTPTPAAAAPEGKAGDQPAAAQAQPQAQAKPQPGPESAAPDSANGKARGGRPKGDKA